MKNKSGRSTGPGQRPRVSRQEITQLAAKIRYDLTAAQAKITELLTMLNAIPIPDEPQAFNAIAARQLVRNTAHVYTDQSLRDELALMGAPVELVDSLLELAGTVRAEAAAV